MSPPRQVPTDGQRPSTTRCVSPVVVAVVSSPVLVSPLGPRWTLAPLTRPSRSTPTASRRSRRTSSRRPRSPRARCAVGVGQRQQPEDHHAGGPHVGAGRRHQELRGRATNHARLKASVRVATEESTLLSVRGVDHRRRERRGGRPRWSRTKRSFPPMGIYVVAAGSWSRATDADSSAEVTSGMFCSVERGRSTVAPDGCSHDGQPHHTSGSTALAFGEVHEYCAGRTRFRALCVGADR